MNLKKIKMKHYENDERMKKIFYNYKKTNKATSKCEQMTDETVPF